jgi:hypothetical protein
LAKKFIIKEAWLLDVNKNKKIKLNTLKEHEIPKQVKEENIRGGYGNIKENK